MKNKTLYWIPKIIMVLLGIFFIIFGEYDDSPGLQGIGLILIIITAVIVIRNKKIAHKNSLDISVNSRYARSNIKGITKTHLNYL